MGRPPNAVSLLLFLFCLETSWETQVPRSVSYPSNATVFSHVYTIKLAGDVMEGEGATSLPQEALGPPGSSHGGGLYEHTLEGPDQEHVVFTHRINLPQQSCGCAPGTEDTRELLKRLQALENEVRTLRDTCQAGSGCCPATAPSQASTGEDPGQVDLIQPLTTLHCSFSPHVSFSYLPIGQTDIRTLCSHHGSFDLSRCQCECEPGWGGPTCAEPACPGGCGGPQRGKCANGRCQCRPGYSGTNCEEPPSCPDNCNDQGRCVDGRCSCFPGYVGPSCSDPACPQDCQGHGQCVSGRCVCNPGYSGLDCGTRSCPSNCNRRGECRNGRCICEPGFTGPACGTKSCPNDCNQRGRCLKGGACACHKGYTGPDCGQVACPEDCSGHGECQNGVCLCHDGYSGDDCATGRQKHTVNISECTNTYCKGQCDDGKGIEWGGGYQFWKYDDCLFQYFVLHKFPIATLNSFCTRPPLPLNFQKTPRAGESVRLSGTETTFERRGLTPGEEYTVTIRAEKGQRYGPPVSQTVQTRVAPPRGLRSSQVTENSITLQWEPPVSHCEGYVLSYVPVVTTRPAQATKRVELPPTPEMVTLEELESNTRYRITLVARQSGESSRATTIVTSPPDHHTTPVTKEVFLKKITQNISAKLSPYNGTLLERLKSYLRATNFPVQGNRTIENVARDIYIYLILITSSPESMELLLDGVRGVSENVIIRFRDMRSGEGGEVVVPGDASKAIITGLAPGTTYQVEIHGVVKGHSSKSYSFITATGTRVGRTSAQPVLSTTRSPVVSLTDLTVTEVSPSSLHVTWSAPPNSFRGFSFQYRDPKSNATPGEIRLPGTERSVNVTGLSPRTDYELQLYGEKPNGLYEGPITSKASTGTSFIPPSLGGISVLEVTDNAARLSWSVATGTFDSFLIQYKDAEGKLKSLPLNGDLREAIISELVPSRKYKFNLYGLVGRKRHGPVSTEAKRLTAPPGLGELSASDITSDSVHLSWSVPSGSFDSFVIQFKDAEGRPQVIPAEGDVREVTIPSLAPSRKYRFNLYGISNRKRLGPATTDVTTERKTRRYGICSAYFGELSASDVTSDSVLLSWTVPTGNFDSFLIQYKDAQGKTQAHPSRRYKFNLYGISGRKRSSPISTEATTGQQEKNEDEPQPPEGTAAQPSLGKLSVSDVTNNSLRLSWTVHTGSFDSFLVQYKDAEGKAQALPVGGDAREVIIPSLAHSHRYKFNLYGVSGRKRSSPLTTEATTGQHPQQQKTQSTLQCLQKFFFPF
uniref:Tenascin XB n=1 Tax=Anolis carolinensis TaxID=28377 RepID=A0A803SN28_ANOCA